MRNFKQHQMSRRDFLRLAGVAGGVAALGAYAPQVLAAPGLRPGRRQEIRRCDLRGLGQGGVAYEPGPEAVWPGVRAETGAKIEFDDQPWEQLTPKLQAELASGQPPYDFFYGDIEFQYFTYPIPGAIEPADPEVRLQHGRLLRPGLQVRRGYCRAVWRASASACRSASAPAGSSTITT